MTPEIEPSIWKTASDYLWAAILIPVKMLWTKADNAVQKDDFKEFIRASKEADETLRQATIKLFDNAERDRERGRETMDRNNERMNQTMQMHANTIMHALAEIKSQCLK